VLCSGIQSARGSGRWTGVAAQRAIATLHGFRFFGLVFILWALVSPDLPAASPIAAYGDFANRVLANAGAPHGQDTPGLWLFVAAQYRGTVDLIVDYYHAIQVGFPHTRSG